MRIILEKSEIIKIVGAHFGVELNPETVTIRTEPTLEVEISEIPLPSEAPSGEKKTKKVQKVEDDYDYEEETMEDIIRTNRSLLPPGGSLDAPPEGFE